MNTNEATQFVQAVARAYPGKVTVTRTVIEQWAHDLAGISVDDANLAWHAFRCHPDHRGHVLTAADVLAMHAHANPTRGRRPELEDRPVVYHLRDAENDDIARRELDKAWAHLGGRRKPSPLATPTTPRTR